MRRYKRKELNIAAYISVLAIIIALIVVFFIMFRYHVEGEEVPPFKITKLVGVSSAKTENIQYTEGVSTADIVQSNDIKIAIQKNPKYKKEAIIKNIIVNNIQIDAKHTKGDIEIYRPSKSNKNYEYIDEYKIVDELIYEGAQETYTKGDILQIANQGGIIDFSIIVNNLGKITYNEDEAVKINGTLLKQIGIKQISFEVKFDLIIELENDIKLKTKITLDLPAGDILENGIETIEKTNMKTIFKRI